MKIDKTQYMTQTVALITDFTFDYYQGIMKSVISQSNKPINFIDLPVRHPQNVINASWVLLNSFNYLPKNSIILIVVDPGVGTDRPALVIKTEDKWIITPDNGIISSIKDKIQSIYELSQNNLKSNTFHGRDLFSPTVRKLINGEEIEEFATKIEKCDLNLENVVFNENEGIIVDIDSFGNIITNLTIETENISTTISIRLDENVMELKFINTFENLGIAEIGCLIGSCNTLEIIKNQGSAFNDFHDLQIGDSVEIIL